MAASTNSWHRAGSERSPSQVSARPPASLIRAATASVLSGLRPANITVTPDDASSSAIAAPNPELAPVITATRTYAHPFVSCTILHNTTPPSKNGDQGSELVQTVQIAFQEISYRSACRDTSRGTVDRSHSSLLRRAFPDLPNRRTEILQKAGNDSGEGVTKSHTFFSHADQRRPTGSAQGSWATARQRGGGVETTGPVPGHWVVQDTAAMSPAEISAASSEDPAAKTTALHQSSGSCSAPPARKKAEPSGLEIMGQDPPVRCGHSHLRSGGPEIDGKHISLCAPSQEPPPLYRYLYRYPTAPSPRHPRGTKYHRTV